MNLERGQFSIDDMRIYDALYDPEAQLWNGWYTPYFTLEQSKQVIAEITDHEHNPMTFKYEENVILYFDKNDFPEGEEIEWTKCNAIEYEGVMRYPLGGWEWIWSKLKTNKEKVEQAIDALFCKIAEEKGIKTGDINPGQAFALEKACEDIGEILRQWEIQNTDSPEEMLECYYPDCEVEISREELDENAAYTLDNEPHCPDHYPHLTVCKTCAHGACTINCECAICPDKGTVEFCSGCDHCDEYEFTPQ